MDAAVVELNTLTNAVGPTTEHHDFFLIRGLRFALFAIGGVHICGVSRKLRRAGIHTLENWAYIGSVSLGAHSRLCCFEQLC